MSVESRSAEPIEDLSEDALATLAHELRSPLQAISGWAALLRDGALDPEQSRRAVDVIVRAAAAQARLIDDLFDRTRIRRGELVVRREWVDVTALVGRVADDMCPLARGRGITLDVCAEGGGRQVVVGDAARLEQVMRNLVANALKFSPSASRIQVLVTNTARQVRISVRDEGGGIRRELLPHVFDGFRLGATVRCEEHAHRGLGLGLSIAKHIVQLHGGSISAESDGAGKGATFRVVLPRAGVERDETAR